MPVHLDDIISGLGMLGGVLSMPRRVEAAEQQNAIERQLLAGTGMSQADIEAATPQPSMHWLSPQQGGFTGKVLGGVGDVGSLLSTIVGKPIPSPRASLADLAESSKMRAEFAKEQSRRRFVDVVKDPKSTPQDIAAAGAEAGSMDAALRFLRPAPPRQPGSAFAARQRLATLDPNSDEAKQLRQGLAEDEAARQRVADEASRRAEERFRKEHPFADIPPEEMQRRRSEEVQRERNAEADRKNLKPGSPEREFYLEHGYQPPPPRQPAPARGMTMKDVSTEVLREMHGEQPNIEPDPDEVRRRIYKRAQSFTQQGIKVEGFDPSIQPPEAPPPPPKPAAPPEKTWGQWLFGGGGETPPTPPSTTTTATTTPPTSTTTPAPTPGPTAASSTGLPPEVMSILDQVPLTSRDQVEQVQAMHDAYNKGMPVEQLTNWAMDIAHPQPQQAAPR